MTSHACSFSLALIPYVVCDVMRCGLVPRNRQFSIRDLAEAPQVFHTR